MIFEEKGVFLCDWLYNIEDKIYWLCIKIVFIIEYINTLHML